MDEEGAVCTTLGVCGIPPVLPSPLPGSICEGEREAVPRQVAVAEEIAHVEVESKDLVIDLAVAVF